MTYKNNFIRIGLPTAQRRDALQKLLDLTKYLGQAIFCVWFWLGLFIFLVDMVLTQAAAASRISDLTEMSIEELMTVEVTHTIARKSKQVTQTAAAVFVITNEDIRRSGVTSIPEALRMVPGLQVAQIDANKWAITARGFNGYFANKLLVLMDGRTVYTPLYSGVYWDVQDIMLEDVARIEVIRGPGASLWGANAVNGVINIITKPASETDGGLAMGGGGTEQRAFGALRYGDKLGKRIDYRIYAKAFNRDKSYDPRGEEAKDAWQAARGGGRMDWQMSDKDLLTLQGDYYNGESGTFGSYPSFDPPYRVDIEKQMPYSGGNLLGNWQRSFADDSELICQIYYDHGSTERGQPLMTEVRDTYDLDLQHRIRVGTRQEVIWGLGYRLTRAELDDNDIASFSAKVRTDDLYSLFIQDEIALLPARLSLLIGSKFEKNEYTDWEIQPDIRMLWLPSDRHTFWAAISRAVKTPSQAEHDARLIQRVMPTTPLISMAYQGSREFRSEELTAYELGYRHVPAESFSLDIALFYNQYDNLKTVEPGDPYLEGEPPYFIVPFYVDNKMEGHTIGAELAVEYRPKNWWRLTGAYTHLQMELKADDDSNSMILVYDEDDSPRHQLSVRSSMNLTRKWELDLWGRYVDELSAQDVPAYTTMDARIAWSPASDLEVSLVGQNLLASNHAEYDSDMLFFYPTDAERGVYGKLTWRF